MRFGHTRPHVFPLGMYERPRTEQEWEAWTRAGINLVRCGDRADLDEVQGHGVHGWLPVPIVLADGDDGSALAAKVQPCADHPALAVWEGPDEVFWWTWRLEPGKPTRFWSLPGEKVAELHRKMDATVRGYERGVEVIRRIDPHRPIWQNEACQSDQESLARILPRIDALGFDYYPVPNLQDRPMEHIGRYVDRFRAAAPAKEIWVVEQAFSWSSLKNEGGEGKPVAYPSVAEYRFMAWQAIAHGATGLLWWGSSHEDRPAPHLDDLMKVVSELREVSPFLVAGNSPAVRTVQDTKRNPAALGVSVLARRVDGRTLVALVNEDPYPADAIVVGLEDDLTEMRPIVEPSAAVTRVVDGYITPLEGYEVRLYLGG